MNDDKTFRWTVALAILFFLCAGVLVAWGIRTDAGSGIDMDMGAALSGFLKLLLGLLIVAIGLVLYFLPALNARQRWHRERKPIFILNLFLGWTFIGWLAAFIWSYTSQVEART